MIVLKAASNLDFILKNTNFIVQTENCCIFLHSKANKLKNNNLPYVQQSGNGIEFTFGGIIGSPGSIQVGIFAGGNGVLASQYVLSATISGPSGSFSALNLDVSEGVSQAYPFGVFYSVPLPLFSGTYNGSFLIQDSNGKFWHVTFSFDV